jgi:hypothetical protein
MPVRTTDAACHENSWRKRKGTTHALHTTVRFTAQVLANDAILCGGIASTQWRVTLMKDQQTALQPTHSFVATFTLRTRALRNFLRRTKFLMQLWRVA